MGTDNYNTLHVPLDLKLQLKASGGRVGAFARNPMLQQHISLKQTWKVRQIFAKSVQNGEKFDKIPENKVKILRKTKQ